MTSADVELMTDLAPETAAAVPAGWDARLPAGVTRRIRVRKSQIGLERGRPWVVCEGAGESAAYAALLIEGPARCVHDADEFVASVETEAPILVRA